MSKHRVAIKCLVGGQAHESTDTVARLNGKEVDGSDDKPPPCVVDHEAPSVAVSCDSSEMPVTIPERWNDWRYHMRSRVRTMEQLCSLFPGLSVSPGMQAAAGTFPLAITPYYASLIRSLDKSDPVFQMCVPQSEELLAPSCLMDDPLGEDADMPVPGLVHRYRDRALLLVTTTCAAYCRHCTRKRVAGQTETTITAARLAQATEYLSVHPEIHDVIISGGDPLTLPTQTLERILRAVRQVPSVDIIRIGTRVPVVLPMRITKDLTSMLRKFHPLFINTHFNHPSELTPQAVQACAQLADAGIPLGNQTVLLRGVNDDARVLEDLFRKLVRSRVKPYYLFQCDLVRGVEHFRTPLSKGIEIMEYLRGRLSGLAIPTFVVDAPHGGGKIPLLPNYVLSSSPTHTVLRNFQGKIVAYPEPSDVGSCLAPAVPDGAAGGVWELLSGAPVETRPHRPPAHARAPEPEWLQDSV